MLTDKIIAIEKRLEDLGYKFFNKTSIDVKYVYYHNPSETIDIKFDYINDEWELLSMGKAKEKKNEEGDVYSISKILGTKTLKTEDMYANLVILYKALPKILNE